jgi:hypothetical protein
MDPFFDAFSSRFFKAGLGAFFSVVFLTAAGFAAIEWI